MKHKAIKIIKKAVNNTSLSTTSICAHRSVNKPINTDTNGNAVRNTAIRQPPITINTSQMVNNNDHFGSFEKQDANYKYRKKKMVTILQNTLNYFCL